MSTREPWSLAVRMDVLLQPDVKPFVLLLDEVACLTRWGLAAAHGTALTAAHQTHRAAHCSANAHSAVLRDLARSPAAQSGAVIVAGSNVEHCPGVERDHRIVEVVEENVLRQVTLRHQRVRPTAQLCHLRFGNLSTPWVHQLFGDHVRVLAVLFHQAAERMVVVVLDMAFELPTLDPRECVQVPLAERQPVVHHPLLTRQPTIASLFRRLRVLRHRGCRKQQ